MNKVADPTTGHNRDRLLFIIAFCFLMAAFIWQHFYGDRFTANDVEPEVRNEMVNWPKSLLPNAKYDQQELRYFEEIAFGSEHIDIPKVIHKWGGDIQIRVEGEPTDDDNLALQGIIRDLNTLQSSITLSTSWFDTGLVITFAPETTFQELHPKYSGSNAGFFWVNWIDDELYRSTILIDSSATQIDRDSIIREEVTQALGLMNDSNRYQDSIFNDDTAVHVPTLAPIDKKLVEMLYHPSIKPGMSKQQTFDILFAETVAETVGETIENTRD